MATIFGVKMPDNTVVVARQFVDDAKLLTYLNKTFDDINKVYALIRCGAWDMLCDSTRYKKENTVLEKALGVTYVTDSHYDVTNLCDNAYVIKHKEDFLATPTTYKMKELSYLCRLGVTYLYDPQRKQWEKYTSDVA